ncbi:MAG TPA: phosphotransferase family protein [Solirubrobacteraceae bacterium]|nr:phosphotransferase family protein [Solirubrobacteraceae bacterium]
MTTTAVPFDVTPVQGLLRERGLIGGPIELRRIGEGHSNLTYILSDGERDLVLRRPPAPPIPPGGHDVLREVRVQGALHGSGVPVAEILAVEDSGEVMGVPFYVMEHIPGTVATVRLPDALESPAERRRLGELLIDTLAALHHVDPLRAGLGDLVRPVGDVERHLRRFAAIVPGELTGDLAGLLESLVAQAPPPAPRPTIVHGDFRLGNVMLAPTAPAQILAVLDWELWTIGDPLRDVGYFLATYAIAEEPAHALTELSAATLAEGWPSRGELAARYAGHTGADLQDLSWYMAMALWKLAILFRYHVVRLKDGIGDPYYATPGLVDGFVRAARQITTPSEVSQ